MLILTFMFTSWYLIAFKTLISTFFSMSIFWTLWWRNQQAALYFHNIVVTFIFCDHWRLIILTDLCLPYWGLCVCGGTVPLRRWLSANNQRWLVVKGGCSPQSAEPLGRRVCASQCGVMRCFRVGGARASGSLERPRWARFNLPRGFTWRWDGVCVCMWISVPVYLQTLQSLPLALHMGPHGIMIFQLCIKNQIANAPRVR